MAETTGWRRPELRPRQQQGGGGPLLLLLLLEEAAAAPAVSCPELLLARLPPASHHLHRAVVDHRHHADLRQRGEQEEACLAGARLHPPRLVLLRRLPGVFNSFHSFLSLTMPSTTKTFQPTIPSLSASPLCLAMATTTTTTTSPCTRSSTCKTILRSEYERSCRSDRRTSTFSCSVFGLRLLTYKTDCAINYTFIH